MAINPVSNTSRDKPMNPQVEANGGYTLPQHVFIPHPALQQISSGNVKSPPATGGVALGIQAHPAIGTRPLPTGPVGVPTHGIRLAIRKASPGV
jgi:hypothetical protein